MNLNQHGKNTSHNEVTNIGPLGFWVLIDGAEYFIPFEEYPVFKDASIKQIFNIVRLYPSQLHWPDLDADIELEALENPEKYPFFYTP
jgi:hypothetical protein